MLHFESVTFQKWLNQFTTMTSCPWFRLQTVLKGGQKVAHLIPWSESWWKQTNNHGGRNLWLMRHGDFLKKHCQTHLHQLQAPVCWPTWRCGCLCRATRWATCREPHPPGTTPGCWLSCRQTDMKVTSGEKLEVRSLFLKTSTFTHIKIKSTGCYEIHLMASLKYLSMNVFTLPEEGHQAWNEPPRAAAVTSGSVYKQSPHELCVSGGRFCWAERPHVFGFVAELNAGRQLTGQPAQRVKTEDPKMSNIK